MSEKINILVTGCGGDIGQSIGKIIKEFNFVGQLYGCDISEKNAAQFIYPNFFIGLPCNNKDYLSTLEQIVEDKEIDVVIPVSEPELRFFAKNNIVGNIGRAKLLMASLKAMKIGFDKYETAKFLEESKLPYPKTELISEVDTPEVFPVILKSRKGSGSSSVFRAKDQEEFEFYKRRNSDFIVQEFLSENDGEYTCGVYRNSSGEVRSIILKRELMGGFSYYGEVVKHTAIEELLCEIAGELNLMGSINVQLRLTDKGPLVFEINPRFSSTVLFRHMLGFKDLLWSVEDLLNLKRSPFVQSAVGKKFYKGFSEYISN